MNIADIRAKYPQYAEVPDEQLLQGLHKKYYSDVPYDEFSSRVEREKPSLKRSESGSGSGQMGRKRRKKAASSIALKGAVSKLAGGATAIGQGLIPFYDELQSGVRAAVDPSLYGDGRSYGDRYDLSQQQIKNTEREFKESNPNTSFGLTASSAFISPLNKLSPVTATAPGLVNALRGSGQNIARNAVEGALYGAGEGEGDNRVDKALEGAYWSGLLTGGMDLSGRAVGGALDMARLNNPLRENIPIAPVTTRDGKAITSPGPIQGEFKSIPFSNPRSVRGGIVREGIGRLPGANERLAEQNAPYVLRARQNVADAEGNFSQQRSNLDDFQRHGKNDLQYDIDTRQGAINRELEAEKLAAAQQADAAAQAKYEAKTSNAAADAVRAEAAAAEEAARLEALNISALKQSVPEGRRDNVTKTGTEGYRQALKQVNDAYSEAWGTSTDLKEGTAATVIDQARRAQEMLTEADAAKLGRFISDVEKLGEEAGSINVLDERLRDLIDSTDGFIRDELKGVRNTLRNGMPAENIAKLNEVDAVYPALLVSQKAARKSGLLGEGIPTVEQYAISADMVAGERRAAAGEQPLRETIRGARPPLKAASSQAEIPAPQPKTPSLERSLRLQAQKEAEAIANARKQRDLAVTSKKQQDALNASEEAVVGPLKEARAKVEKDARVPNESLYMSALLGNLIPGGGPIGPRAGAAAWLGRKLVTEGGQEFLAGQGKRTRQLADAIRSGRTEYVTRGAARNAALLANKDEEEFY